MFGRGWCRRACSAGAGGRDSTCSVRLLSGCSLCGRRPGRGASRGCRARRGRGRGRGRQWARSRRPRATRCGSGATTGLHSFLVVRASRWNQRSVEQTLRIWPSRLAPRARRFSCGRLCAGPRRRSTRTGSRDWFVALGHRSLRRCRHARRRRSPRATSGSWLAPFDRQGIRRRGARPHRSPPPPIGSDWFVALGRRSLRLCRHARRRRSPRTTRGTWLVVAGRRRIRPCSSRGRSGLARNTSGRWLAPFDRQGIRQCGRRAFQRSLDRTRGTGSFSRRHLRSSGSRG
jgi:hypothetical protein